MKNKCGVKNMIENRKSDCSTSMFFKVFSEAITVRELPCRKTVRRRYFMRPA